MVLSDVQVIRNCKVFPGSLGCSWNPSQGEVHADLGEALLERNQGPLPTVPAGVEASTDLPEM